MAHFLFQTPREVSRDLFAYIGRKETCIKMAQWLNGRARHGIVCQHLRSIPNHALFLTALFNQCRLSPYGIRGLQLIIITNDLFNRPVLCHPWMIRGLNPCGVHGLSAWIP